MHQELDAASSAARHTDSESSVPAAMGVTRGTIQAARPVLRVVALVVLVTLLILFGLPWILAAGAAAAR